MAIDRASTKDSLFGGLKKTEKPTPQVESESNEAEHSHKAAIEIKQPDNDQALPKWQTLDKVTVLLSTEQKDGLDRIAKKIMKHRAKESKGMEKERITTNTLIRALVDNFLEIERSSKPDIITTESDVREWIKKMFKY